MKITTQIFVLILITFFMISCSAPNQNPVTIMVDKRGFHWDGEPIETYQLINNLSAREAAKDTSAITIELRYGYRNEDKFELKYLLEQHNMTNLKEKRT